MNNLTRKEAKHICDEFIEKKYTDKEITNILIKLSKKGETAEEIVGFSDSLLMHAEPFPSREAAFDVCGTGGSKVERFNVSTSVAFVLASLGIKVAKHGNRGSHKQNGSFDLLEELGIDINVDGYVLSDCLAETNLAFIFARKFHPAMMTVARARKMVGHRTIFNLAGPISNPANIEKQIIGTTDKRLIAVLVDAGLIVGRRKLLVVSGYPEIDELSVAGASVIALHGLEKEINPEQINLQRHDYSKIPCGDAKFNAKEFYKLINNSADKSLEDMVCANTGLALALINKNETITVADIKKGVNEARNALHLGLVKKKFEEYKKAVTQKIK